MSIGLLRVYGLGFGVTCRSRAVGLKGFNAEGMASWLQALMRRRGASQIGKLHMGGVFFFFFFFFFFFPRLRGT